MRNMMSDSIRVLLLGISVLYFAPAQAEPVNHPGNCGPFTGDIYACRGTVICTASGDFMCCVKNDHGGQDCEQIETKTINPGGSLKIPGGNVKVAPMNPQPNTSRFPQGGMNAPVMRRGVEGEQPEGGTTTPSDTSAETK
ncbi:MAG TPA: hypothetical protein VJ746_11790 [Nitrospira sp.]|nr:hypothetical protein [Nitrospira sp.]